MFRTRTYVHTAQVQCLSAHQSRFYIPFPPLQKLRYLHVGSPLDSPLFELEEDVELSVFCFFVAGPSSSFPFPELLLLIF